MATETKRVADLPIIEEMTEEAKLLVEEGGMTKRIANKQAIPQNVVKTVNGAGPDESGDVKVNGLPEGAGTHQQLVTDANGVAKWEDKPFYDESDILYNGYPEYAFGYAKLSFVLKEDVEYKLGYINDEGNAVGSAMPYVATRNTYGIIGFSDDDETRGFRLEYSESDGYCYFYPDGTVFKGGEPETSDDGTYAYTSKVMLVIGYADDADVGVVPLPERYVPSAVPVIQSATVGQTIVVKAVDDAGKPTEWDAVDVPYYGQYKLYVREDGYLHKTDVGAYNGTEDDIITREELGDIAANHPIVIMDAGLYSGVIGSKSVRYPDMIDWTSVTAWGYARCGDVEYCTAEYTDEPS